MTHLPGRETGRLSPQTLACYKTRLKKLWRIYPHLTDEHEKDMCMKEMLKLSDKTGLELGGPTLMRGAGRPRERLTIGEAHKEILEKEDAEKWKTTVEDAEEVKKSERELHLMELLAKQGITPEMVAERNKKLQEESMENKKAQELQQAIDDTVKKQERLLGRKCTDQEKALIETEIHEDFIKLANEQLEREGGAKSKTTGS